MSSLETAKAGLVYLSNGDEQTCFRVIIGDDPDPERENYAATAEYFEEFPEALNRFKELKVDYPETCMRLLAGEPEIDIEDMWEVDRDHLAMIERQQSQNYRELTYYTLRRGGLSQNEAVALSGLQAIPFARSG